MADAKKFIQLEFAPDMYYITTNLNKKNVNKIWFHHSKQGFIQYTETPEGLLVLVDNPVHDIATDIDWWKANNLPRIAEVYDEAIIREYGIDGEIYKRLEKVTLIETMEAAI
ncbi:hypothetical protein RsTz2092_07250 [Deferribacterales bacterium RsTz2092]|nr:hypothetical protein AGMMS49941_04120 [Deferribacterales bacterium]